jgi:anti-anti-sigma factor
MNTALCQDEALVVAPEEMTELVRGDEECLVQSVAPLLREKDVILDLNRIERIDAAGIAALISLYSMARTYGRTFSVKCVSPRVAEMLTLVRLNNVLISHNAVFASQCEAAFERPAA